MKNLLLASLFFSFFTYGFSQNTWTQKADFGGGIRYAPAGFSIGTKGYVGTGYISTGNYKKDFWEFDPATNVWTQKADFDGAARYGATGLTIGSKGYIGTGYNGSYMNDFWEYTPGTNTWVQKANFSGGTRYHATGFSIGSKAYIGTGYNGSVLNDFWEYDPSTNNWTSKASLTTARQTAVGFSIDNKGYIGTGYSTTSLKDFWEYDQSSNTWTKKADYPGLARYGAISFAITTSGYKNGFVGNGFNGSTYYTDFWKYDPYLNNWIQIANFGSTGIVAGIGLSINGKGYVGLGRDNGVIEQEFWEYAPADALITMVNQDTLCAGDTIFINYSSNFVLESGNTFTAELSDASGSFSGTTAIGSSSSTSSSGSVMAIIPSNTAGSNYKIRISSSNPAFTGTENSESLTIGLPPNLMIAHPPAVCAPNTVDITTAFTDDNSTTGTVTYWSDANATINVPKPDSINFSGTYYIKKITSQGCMDIKPVIVTVNNCTGIEEKGNAGINLFPNPINDYLTISGAEEIASISIMDLSGRILYDEKSPGNYKRINMEHLSTGVYFVMIKTKQKTITKKVVMK